MRRDYWKVNLFGTAMRWTEDSEDNGFTYAVMIGLESENTWAVYGPDITERQDGIYSVWGFTNWEWAYR